MRICVKNPRPSSQGVVGVRKPTVNSTETSVLLRRFPQKDCKDFVLPRDVVFFCQSEGCSTVSKKFSFCEANSFAFTLTEKDSGKVVMEFVLMCFDLVRTLFTRKETIAEKEF